MIAYVEGWRRGLLMVGGLRHGILSFLHMVAEKLVNFIKVDGEVTCS